MISITINNQKIETEEGKTILEVAIENKIDIPALCYHSDLKPKESCRLCIVEIKGEKGLFTSCSTFVKDGMEIITDSEEIQKTRQINLSLIFAEHIEKCPTCIWSNKCKMLELAKKWDLKINTWEERKKDYPKYQFGNAIIYDSSKCISCANCVEICQKQGVGYLELEKQGEYWAVVPSKDKNKDCVYCGQCVVHCPSGSFSSVNPAMEIQKEIQDENKFVVFQFAPSIRTSIGEEFGFDYGEIIIEKMIAGMKKLGADRVFDVSVGADLTAIEEANELIERLETKKGLPMFTSCCPAWVKFVEFYKPEFIPNLTTVRSPQILLGGVIKTYFAEKENIDPKNIVVVSVMPCTSKKYEIQRKELEVDGLKPVDYVLTTHELSRMFLDNKIDLKTIEGEERDSFLGIASSAGVIFGASGGVCESAARTAAYKILGKKLDKLEFNEFRGMQGVKEAVVKIKDIELKIAIVNGLGNAKELLENHPEKYDYIEVMSCPGGCIGGGGQPVPVDEEIRKLRAAGLYKIDDEDNLRIADENPIVQKIYKEFLVNKEIINKISYTSFSKKEKEN